MDIASSGVISRTEQDIYLGNIDWTNFSGINENLLMGSFNKVKK